MRATAQDAAAVAIDLVTELHDRGHEDVAMWLATEPGRYRASGLVVDYVLRNQEDPATLRFGALVDRIIDMHGEVTR